MNKKNGIKGENFGGNTEVFPVGKSHYELLWLLYRTMLGDTDSYKVGEELGCNKGILLGLYEWAAEGITQEYLIGPIEVNIECTQLGIYLSEILKEWSNHLYLNWRIMLRGLISYKLQWTIMNRFLMV